MRKVNTSDVLPRELQAFKIRRRRLHDTDTPLRQFL